MTSHMQICHRWAQRDENLNVKGYAIIADGLSIFSYGRHFTIAKWFQPVPGADWCIWFNDESRSVSTSKHQTYVRRAIPDNVPVFTLPETLWIPDFSDNQYLDTKQKKTAIKAAVAKAVAWYEAQALEYYTKAKRARTHAAWHTQRVNDFVDSARDLSRLYGVTYTAPDFDDLKAKAEVTAKAAVKAVAKAAIAREKVRREAYAKARAEWRDNPRWTFSD